MRAAKVDATQAGIVRVFRQLGGTVEHLHTIRGGCPDLLLGFCGTTVLVEVKDGAKSPSRRRLRESQERWRRVWRGGPVVVVASEDEAAKLMLKIAKRVTCIRGASVRVVAEDEAALGPDHG